jgi:hypothetical protein
MAPTNKPIIFSLSQDRIIKVKQDMGILVKDNQKKGPTSSSRSSLSDKCKWEK